jgi:hypothetical protein
MKLNFFLWERHLMAAAAFGEGRLPRRADFAKAALATTAESWLDLPAEASAQAGATPTRATLH